MALCAVLLLAGCFGGDRQDEAAKLASRMNTAIQKQDWDAAMSLYDDKFFAAVSRKLWRDKLEALPKRFGLLSDIKLTFAQNNPRFGNNHYIFGYQLNYQHGVVDETITIVDVGNKGHLVVRDQIFKHGENIL